MVRWSFILAAIPVVIFAIAGTGKTKAPVPIVVAKAPVIDVGPRVVRTESISGFDGRWALPPPPIDREVRHVREKTDDVVDAVPVAASTAPQPVAPSRHRLKTKRAHLDLCGRHGMRKVITRGGKSWRCRR